MTLTVNVHVAVWLRLLVATYATRVLTPVVKALPGMWLFDREAELGVTVGGVQGTLA